MGTVPVLRESLVEGFGAATVPWVASMAGEDGIAVTRRFENPAVGGVLGLRVDFLRRSSSSVLLLAPRPILIEGTCTSLSVRALGRSFRHSASLVVLDYYGRPYDLPLGALDFAGWRTLRAYVPPFDPATGLGIVQDDPHFLRQPGLRLAGIRIDFDLEEAYGGFYAYFSELRAVAAVSGAEEAEAPGSIESPKVQGGGAAAPPAAPAEQGAASKGAPPELRVLALISERVAAAQTYPEAARRRGVSGSLVAAFTVAPDGSLASAQVARSSGSDILDRAGLDLLKGAFPVENDAHARLSLRITITYRLESAP